MEELFAAYTLISLITCGALWLRGNKWQTAFHNKPVQQIVHAPKPKPAPEGKRISNPTLEQQALALTKRMDRVGGRSGPEKKAYVMNKLHLRHPQLSYEQASKLIEQAL